MLVDILQADRDAAANYVQAHNYLWAQDIRAGKSDTHFAVQAFAAHREACIALAIPASKRAGEEPFGYWVEQKHAEPMLLRKPAYIPEPSDLRTVTPLYAYTPIRSPASDDGLEGLREALQYAIEAVGREADHAMKVTKASRWVVEEIEAKEARFKASLAALSDRSAAMELREAAQQVLDRMSDTYKARNGREVGIQGDDGEKCWIVHSDDIEELRRALARQMGERGNG